jgi:hypothetical protein
MGTSIRDESGIGDVAETRLPQDFKVEVAPPEGKALDRYSRVGGRADAARWNEPDTRPLGRPSAVSPATATCPGQTQAGGDPPMIARWNPPAEAAYAGELWQPRRR